MTHGRDHGDLGGGHGSRQPLVVEAPQILGGASSAADDDEVDSLLGIVLHGVEVLDASPQVGGCLRALHQGGEYENFG